MVAACSARYLTLQLLGRCISRFIQEVLTLLLNAIMLSLIARHRETMLSSLHEPSTRALYIRNRLAIAIRH